MDFDFAVKGQAAFADQKQLTVAVLTRESEILFEAEEIIYPVSTLAFKFHTKLVHSEDCGAQI